MLYYRILHALGTAMLVIALVLIVVSVASEEWQDNAGSSAGLWRVCPSVGACTDLSTFDEMDAVRALMLLAVICAAAAFVIAIVEIAYRGIRHRTHRWITILTCVLAFLAAIFSLAGIIVYNVDVFDPDANVLSQLGDYGYSFWLGVAAIIFLFIAAFFFLAAAISYARYLRRRRMLRKRGVYDRDALYYGVNSPYYYKSGRRYNGDNFGRTNTAYYQENITYNYGDRNSKRRHSDEYPSRKAFQENYGYVDRKSKRRNSDEFVSREEFVYNDKRSKRPKSGDFTGDDFGVVDRKSTKQISNGYVTRGNTGYNDRKSKRRNSDEYVSREMVSYVNRNSRRRNSDEYPNIHSYRWHKQYIGNNLEDNRRGRPYSDDYYYKRPKRADENHFGYSKKDVKHGPGSDDPSSGHLGRLGGSYKHLYDEFMMSEGILPYRTPFKVYNHGEPTGRSGAGYLGRSGRDVKAISDGNLNFSAYDYAQNYSNNAWTTSNNYSKRGGNDVSDYYDYSKPTKSMANGNPRITVQDYSTSTKQAYPNATSYTREYREYGGSRLPAVDEKVYGQSSRNFLSTTTKTGGVDNPIYGGSGVFSTAAAGFSKRGDSSIPRDSYGYPLNYDRDS